MLVEIAAHALPKHVPDLVTDVPKTIQSEMKDIFDADTERNILKSHILTRRDKMAVNGEHGTSSSSANPGRSAERWRRFALLRSGDVEPKPGPPRARSRGGELLTTDITAGTVAKFRRAFDAFDFHPVVTRAVCFLHTDFSPLSKLSRGTWNGLLDFTNLFLAFRELWSLLCVELFSVQFSSVRRLLIPVFISVLCGECINLNFSHYHQNPAHPWTRHCRSRFESGDYVFAVLESVRIESPPSDFLDPHMTSRETADACLVVLAHEAFESSIPVDIETPICFSLDDTRVFSSVSMTFLLKQGLEIEVVFVTLERASLLLMIGT